MAPSSSVPALRTSLLTAQDCRGHVHIIVGLNSLAGTRCSQSLAVGAKPVLVAPDGADLPYTLQQRIDAGEVTWLRKDFEDGHLFSLGREEVERVVDAVFVTSGPRDPLSQRISNLCRRHRIPVNVVDAPALCSFSLLSTHTDGPLQIGLTTNGMGCKLASRIRREVVAGLPAGLGTACARMGHLRTRIRQEDQVRLGKDALQDVPVVPEELTDEGVVVDQGHDQDQEGHDDDSAGQTADFNRLVTNADAEAVQNRRMRWLAQVCEYWPLKHFTALTDEDFEAVLHSYPSTSLMPNGNHDRLSDGQHDGTLAPTPAPRSGRLILAGSGPGHPDLLTLATHKAIQAADLILADKLVPSGVLELIPRRTPVSIARKFPGNADAAQDELLSSATSAVRQGKTVLRLKQGDPFLYGRGGEEVLHFRKEGLGDRVSVLPGLTSSLCAPLFAGIPVTMRDVADSVLVCTGTGKKGKAPDPPGWRKGRTVVFLMALHRIVGLIAELTGYTAEEEAEIDGTQGHAVGATGGDSGVARSQLTGPRRRLWPKETPCAVVERASCPDQRVIRTTLECVARAIEQEGSRPPGLLVVGQACEALYSPERGKDWVVEDGFKGLDLDTLVPGFTLNPFEARV
jgi:uroporphyrin-III C-methyltransferase